ncbi:phosphoethanolamine transferase [Campylobacter sp. US33a]|uniref:phosphoethanolamine transferase n=1 Tax=Campylobacter sp. US33a TaxID=2498120 RepID=UPI001067AB40|nr:sulfatase-like hydrolase/transferase [Campylobacter sp. US33a]TEY04632.1 hypothetical protein ELQ16_01000 [Campylobacter sp. US33a]
MVKQRYFDFIVKYFPYISLIFILDISISLWWSYLTFERDILEWLIFKALKNIVIVFVLNIFIIHIFFLFFKEKARFFLYFITIYAIFAFILQGYLLANYSTKFNPLFIDLIFQTDLKEIREFAEFYIDFKLIVTCVLFFFCVFLWFIFTKKNQKYLHISNKKILTGMCFIYIAVILGLVLDCANRYFAKKHGINSIDKINFSFLIDIPEQFFRFYSNNGIWANYNFYLNNYEKVANSYRGGVSVEKKIPYIILVIGESTQRNYMSLYGYNLETTPNLKVLERNGNLIKFNDVISPFASTQASLRRVMNFSNIENEENWHDRLNIVDLFELAGYKSIFISNHEPMSGHTSITTAVANRAEETIFLNKFATDDKIFTKALDAEMLSLIEDRINKKDFFILQLMGTHFRYDRRYDKGFAKFNADDIDRNLEIEEKEIVATYANSVLYNDYFVNEIFDLFKDKEVVIVYMSDHGESVYEYRDRAEHFVTSKFTAEIPFFFIVSDKFKQNNPKLVDKILKAKDRPFMIDDLIHVMVTIGGIKVKDYEATRDVLSKDFNTKRIRFFNGKVDYDKTLKSEKAKH